MRRGKTFKLEGYEHAITVYELTPRNIIKLFTDSALKASDWTVIMAYVQSEILPQCVDLSVDDLLDFAPSQLQAIWEHFKKVNSVFFDLSKQLGLDKLLEQIQAELQQTCGVHVVTSLRQAMLESLITGTPSSLSPSTNINESNSDA